MNERTWRSNGTPRIMEAATSGIPAEAARIAFVVDRKPSRPTQDRGVEEQSERLCEEIWKTEVELMIVSKRLQIRTCIRSKRLSPRQRH
jgi:hypothetical protein